MPRRERQAVRVVKDIIRRIESGEFQPGEKLPTKAELMAEYQVTKHVIDDAMRTLNDQGAVVGVQGSGVFVPFPGKMGGAPDSSGR